MRITRMEVVNFKGIKKAEYDLKDKITLILAKNGSGKTSFIDALRYGLTGCKPEGEVINKTADECSVTIYNDSGESFTRIERRDKPSKFKLNGHSSTKVAMEDVLRERTGIDISGLNILTSGELLGKMTPSEMGDVIMKYVPDSLTIEKVMAYMGDDVTPGMKEMIENNLPSDEFGSVEVESFNQMVRSSRRAVNAKLKELTGRLSAFPSEAPARTKEQILSRQKEIAGLVKEQALYVEKKRVYEKACTDYKRISDQLKEMAENGPKHKVERPDPQKWTERKNSLMQKEEVAKKDLSEKTKVLTTMQNSLVQMEKALENLTKSYCPLSNKLNCTTDKTPLKTEFEKTISELKSGIETQNTAIQKAEQVLETIREELAELEQQKTDFNNYVVFITGYTNLKKTLPEIPEKPEEIHFEQDPEKEMAALNKELNLIDGWEKFQQVKKDIDSLKVQATDLDRLVKAFDPKGEVKKGIINDYITILEEYCNGKAMSLGTGFKFRFEEADGMKITCDTGKGSYLPFGSLSGGEQMYMLYILMDMLNCLTNSRILIMDELSVLDDENLDKLLTVVNENSADYNNIILAGVRGEESARENGINRFQI